MAISAHGHSDEGNGKKKHHPKEEVVQLASQHGIFMYLMIGKHVGSLSIKICNGEMMKIGITRAESGEARV